jgi:hypothetical protein
MVMFYEIEAAKDFANSVKNACFDIENKENIEVEYLLNMSELTETLDTNQITKDELINSFVVNCVNSLMDAGIKTTYKIHEDNSSLYSIGSYRRDLNYFNCLKVDYIVWGESDCLMPRQYFEAVEQVSSYAKQVNINRYCLTFAVRKMWDSSWSVLEHVDFQNETFLPSTHESCSTTPSSIWYYMSEEEMNSINNKFDQFEIMVLDYPRFDGSLLTISKDLLLNGINIPPAVSGTGEDTAFQNSIKTIMGTSYVQFVIKNVLKVHNRNHPFKRNYILGEDSSSNVRDRRSANQVFDQIHKKSNYNLSLIGPNQNKFETI